MKDCCWDWDEAVCVLVLQECVWKSTISTLQRPVVSPSAVAAVVVVEVPVQVVEWSCARKSCRWHPLDWEVSHHCQDSPMGTAIHARVGRVCVQVQQSCVCRMIASCVGVCIESDWGCVA